MPADWGVKCSVLLVILFFCSVQASDLAGCCSDFCHAIGVQARCNEAAGDLECDGEKFKCACAWVSAAAAAQESSPSQCTVDLPADTALRTVWIAMGAVFGGVAVCAVCCFFAMRALGHPAGPEHSEHGPTTHLHPAEAAPPSDPAAAAAKKKKTKKPSAKRGAKRVTEAFTRVVSGQHTFSRAASDLGEHYALGRTPSGNTAPPPHRASSASAAANAYGLRVPSEASAEGMLRVPSDFFVSAPATPFAASRAPSDHMIRAPSDHIVRVPSDHIVRVPSGHIVRVPSGHMPRVTSDHLVRVPSGPGQPDPTPTPALGFLRIPSAVTRPLASVFSAAAPPPHPSAHLHQPPPASWASPWAALGASFSAPPRGQEQQGPQPRAPLPQAPPVFVAADFARAYSSGSDMQPAAPGPAVYR